MPRPEQYQDHLDRLRQWRSRPEPDLSLGFLREQFKRRVEKPHKQLAAIVEAWQKFVPAALLNYCRLESLSRGVLTVGVDDSAHLYDLDRLLRQGLEQQVRAAAKGPTLRRVQLRLSQAPQPAPRKAAEDADE
jgi:hypothetical protein